MHLKNLWATTAPGETVRIGSRHLGRAAIAIAVLMLFASGVMATPAFAAQDAYEPDDTHLEAKMIAADGIAQSRTIYPQYDLDFIGLQVSSGHTYSIETSAAASLDLAMMLVRPTGEPNTYNGIILDFGGNTYNLISLDFGGMIMYAATKTETLFLLLSSNSCEATGSYQVVVREVTPDAYEPDNTPGEAKEIAVDGASQVRNIFNDDDVDWVRFQAQVDRTYVVEVASRETEIHADIDLFASDGESWLEDLKMEYAGRRALRVSKTGTYYLKVSSYTPFLYELSIWSILPDAYEPDDEPEQAKPITTDRVPQTHTLEYSDKDWVSFPVVDGWTYVVKTFSAGGRDVATRLIVYDKYNDEVVSGRSQVTFGAPYDGVCKVAVTGAGNDDVGDYRILVEEVPAIELGGSVDFGDVAAGRYVVKTVELHNPSDATIKVNLALTGWAVGEYQILDRFTSIPANATVNVRLKYAPKTAFTGGPNFASYGEPIETVTEYSNGRPNRIRRTIHVQNKGGTGQANYTAHAGANRSAGSLQVKMGDRYRIMSAFGVMPINFHWEYDYGLTLPVAFVDRENFPRLVPLSAPAVTASRLPDGTLEVDVIGVDANTSSSVDLFGTSHKGQAYVSTPVAPSVMYTSRSSTVYGYLKPRHTAGTYPVRIYKYRYVSGKWASYGYVKAKASNYSSYTKYSASVTLPSKGTWRLRAYHPADAEHAASWSSGYDYVTVK